MKSNFPFVNINLLLKISWSLLVLLIAGCSTAPAAEQPPTTDVDTPTPVATATLQAPTRQIPTPTAEKPIEEAAAATPEPTATPEPGPVTPPTAPPEPSLQADQLTSVGAGFALRFFGTGSGDIDRIKIPIDAPGATADVGTTDFTLEWWMKADPGANNSGDCTIGNDNWITGNIIFDRDVWGDGDYGDYGVSLAGGQLAFGVNNGLEGAGICSVSTVADGAWHHIAVIRRQSDGLMGIFVDGRLEVQANGPGGDVSYREGRPTEFANDPFLVIGAEKHDAGSEYPSFSGWVDEVRLSTVLRYTADFPRPAAPFESDPDTAALWHFDEGSGDVVNDSASGGQTVGSIKVGGPNQGPHWVVSDAPLLGE